MSKCKAILDAKKVKSISLQKKAKGSSKNVKKSNK